jgi:hypothetical protein
LHREIEAAAAALTEAAEFPAARVLRVRAAAARMAASEFRADDLRTAALFLERSATIDLQVPTSSRVPGASLVKRVLKKLMIWYLRFLGHQVTAFGQATARFGVTVANRVDGVETDVAELKADLARLQDRVAQLEAGVGERAPGRSSKRK